MPPKNTDPTSDQGRALQGAAPNVLPPSPAAAAADRLPEGWVRERTRVAVGHGITVSGKLIFQEPVRIEGYFRGEVGSTDLVVVAEEATVEGRVKAARLVVLGELRGEVRDSGRVYLAPGSRVRASICAAYLTICEGARFDGAVRMTHLGAESQKSA